jgi:hypothetical protein
VPCVVDCPSPMHSVRERSEDIARIIRKELSSRGSSRAGMIVRSDILVMNDGFGGSTLEAT